jgi:DNA mismatch repair protein MutS2
LEHVRSEIRRIRSGITIEPTQTTTATQKADKELARLLDENSPITTAVQVRTAPSEQIQLGDIVYVSMLGQTGELLSINGQEAEVRVGGFRLRTRSNMLEFRERPIRQPEISEAAMRGPITASPGMELDLRGWRAEAVAPELDKYLNSAYLAELPWVHIVHGKGMGILKEVVRQYVTNHPLVASFRLGQSSEGGDGVTIITLHRRRE